jgi:PAS domain S-box-containing protein
MSEALSKKIEQSERVKDLLLNNLVDLVWVLDARTLKYLYISPTVEQVRGFTQQEVMSSSLEDNLSPDSLAKAKAYLETALEKYEQGQEMKPRLELEMKHKNGSPVWLEVSARFFKDRDGSLKILGVSKDITKRKKITAKYKVLIRELKQSLKREQKLSRENRVLRGLLPVCAWCRKIRDEHGQWWDMEAFIASRTEADFTHTICPSCRDKFTSSGDKR